jgi:hypothetical protein
MTAILLLSAALAYPPIDVDLAAAPVERLARHDGCRVRCTVTVLSVWPADNYTTLGVVQDERTVYVTGPCGANRGDTITVEGTLAVVRHEVPAGGVAGVPAAGWTEYVIRDAKVVRP